MAVPKPMLTEFGVHYKLGVVLGVLLVYFRPMSKDNAARACKRMGKSLVLVTSQSENDALSELLLSTGILLLPLGSVS